MSVVVNPIFTGGILPTASVHNLPTNYTYAAPGCLLWEFTNA